MPSLVTESKRWWRSEPLEASHQHSKTHHRFSAQTPSLRSPCSSRFYALVSSSVISSKRTAGLTNLLLPFFWWAVELEDYCFSSFMDNLFDKNQNYSCLFLIDMIYDSMLLVTGFVCRRGGVTGEQVAELAFIGFQWGFVLPLFASPNHFQRWVILSFSLSHQWNLMWNFRSSSLLPHFGLV